MMKRNFEVDIQKKLWANNKVPYVIIETSFGKISILNQFNIKRPKQNYALSGRFSLSNIKGIKDNYPTFM